MGKVRLVVQRRGKGSPTFRTPTHRALGKVRLPQFEETLVKGKVLDIKKDSIHYAPLMIVEWENGELSLLPAPLGISVGDTIYYGPDAPNVIGSIKPLDAIPEGSRIYMLENNPGDGGKLVRASGAAARLISHIGDKVVVELPSRKKIILPGHHRAVIGVIAGGGRTEKPFVKASNKEKYMRAHSKLARWPRVKGVAMNAVDHPLGGKHRKKGKPTTISTERKPPGARFGHMNARRTGVRK